MIDKDLLEKLYKNKQQELTKILDPTPQPVLPIITQKDTEVGYLTRYFVRSVNDITYVVEIDKKQYQTFKNNPRFVTTSIKWKIVGKKETTKLSSGVNLHGVEDLNRITVANADLTFGGLHKYITNYLEYWVMEN